MSDRQKASFQRDSIKKSKMAPDIEEKRIDSLVNVLAVFKPFKKEAHASYYADKFNGRRTTSGRKFDNNKYTAAHKKLPFGTKVRVTNEKNGKSVVVEITDRGPFVKSREIDLSKRAFMDITSNKSSGGMQVTIEIMAK
ncbi:septal ring lytic transglycosylase RlpA family protein [Flavobacterium sp. LB2R40]|uniref:septal ring lytic transglycosylase RlpA family protein n=1 Tax=unclassified Flavobacterium TaxID=196869 RepID=UPI003AAE0EC1